MTRQSIAHAQTHHCSTSYAFIVLTNISWASRYWVQIGPYWTRSGLFPWRGEIVPMEARGGVGLHGVKRTIVSLEGRRWVGDSCHSQAWVIKVLNDPGENEGKGQSNEIGAWHFPLTHYCNVSMESVFMSFRQAIGFQNSKMKPVGTPYSKKCLLLLIHRPGQVTHIRPLVQSLTHGGWGPHTSVRAPEMGSV